MPMRYYCDAEKNTACEKTYCQFNGTGECEATLNKEYAQLDYHGKPKAIDDTIPTLEDALVDLERTHEMMECSMYAEAEANIRSVMSRLEHVVKDLLISKAEEAEKQHEQALIEAPVWGVT